MYNRVFIYILSHVHTPATARARVTSSRLIAEKVYVVTCTLLCIPPSEVSKFNTFSFVSTVRFLLISREQDSRFFWRRQSRHTISYRRIYLRCLRDVYKFCRTCVSRSTTRSQGKITSVLFTLNSVNIYILWYNSKSIPESLGSISRSFVISFFQLVWLTHFKDEWKQRYINVTWTGERAVVVFIGHLFAGQRMHLVTRYIHTYMYKYTATLCSIIPFLWPHFIHIKRAIGCV